MLTFGELTFDESELAYIRAYNKTESGGALVEDYPYVINVRLKSGLEYGRKFKLEKDRDRKLKDLTECASRTELFAVQSEIMQLREETAALKKMLKEETALLERLLREKAPEAREEGRPATIGGYLPGNADIEELELSVRGFNILRRAGINTIDDIRNTGMDGIMSLRNMGRKTMNEVMEKYREKTGEELE